MGRHVGGSRALSWSPLELQLDRAAECGSTEPSLADVFADARHTSMCRPGAPPPAHEADSAGLGPVLHKNSGAAKSGCENTKDRRRKQVCKKRSGQVRSKPHVQRHMGMEGTISPRNRKRGFGVATLLVETTKHLPTLQRYQPPVQPAGKLEKPRPVSVGPYILACRDP